MRTLMAVLIGIVLLSARASPERAKVPTVSADSVTVSEVRQASEFPVFWLGSLRDPCSWSVQSARGKARGRACLSSVRKA